MKRTLIKNAQIVNEGKIIVGDVLIEGERIAKIGQTISVDGTCREINAEGKYLIPGVIDDQVHFREPGLTHKATIASEAKAAVAGGITSFMEMPNTVPNALTQELLEDKYQIAAKGSLANYSFFMGASNDNLQEVLKTNPKNVAGIKVFMGSSTGNMLVDKEAVLEQLFINSPMLIATHCEDEATIRKNTEIYKVKYGEDVPMRCHPEIRSVEACYLSSSKAVALAKKTNARLHVLHISTAKETELFRNDIPLKEKRITAEACVHHLWFDDSQYDTKGSFIKWNPAVKSKADQEGIWKALLDDRIDILATDHAPHTLEEKSGTYFNAPSGGPLVQHHLPAVLESVLQERITMVKAVEKMSHAPADCFQVANRGFIREGYQADLVLVDPKNPWTVSKDNILYQCGWSPFEGQTFQNKVEKTFVNGHLVYDNGNFDESVLGQRLTFER
jgi:dihydroorotase